MPADADHNAYLALIDAADLIESLARRASSAEKAGIVTFKAEAWEDDEYIITANGEPVGRTIARQDRQIVVDWIGSAWADLIRANARAALEEKR